MKKTLLALFIVYGCGHGTTGPSSSGDSALATEHVSPDDAERHTRLEALAPLQVDDRVGWDTRELPLTFRADWADPAVPSTLPAVLRAEKAALALGGVRAQAVTLSVGQPTWSLVEVWQADVWSCHLTLVACDDDRCDANVLVRLREYDKFPSTHAGAILRDFERQGAEVRIELLLTVLSEWGDSDEPKAEHWSGHATFVRSFGAGLSGWNALTRKSPTLEPSSGVAISLPASPDSRPGGYWVGEQPPELP